MHKTHHGELVFTESDLSDLIMQGKDITKIDKIVIDPVINLETLVNCVEDPGTLLTYTFPENREISVLDFDLRRQKKWFMPQEYQDLDIAKHVLDSCSTQAELQRVGQELLLYQEKDLFDLLKYMKYLVDIMRENHIVWGVGRGSSVSSYVLYLLGVHRVDSMYYDLNHREFLR